VRLFDTQVLPDAFRHVLRIPAIDKGYFTVQQQAIPEALQSLDQKMQGRLELAWKVACQAAEVTRGFFRSDRFQIERKNDRTPVTTADRQAELTARKMISGAFPADGILGEEYGEQPGQSEYRWIIDPIDGTKSFICGVPLYSTLLGLMRRDEPVAGIIAIPVLQEAAFGVHGGGCWYVEGNSPWKQARVSSVSQLREGLFVSSQVDSFERRGAHQAYQRLQATASITRTWGDGYGYLLVATGRAEAMVDPIVSPWDVAAIEPVVVEAGGRCTSWSGPFNLHAGELVGTNGQVHQEVLQLLSS
jgi:histidinol phosphatase-like enzyme (inositol monophosphatase family)